MCNLHTLSLFLRSLQKIIQLYLLVVHWQFFSLLNYEIIPFNTARKVNNIQDLRLKIKYGYNHYFPLININV